MPSLCLQSMNKLMLLAICIFPSACRHDSGNPNAINEILPDKNAASQPIMQGMGAESSGESGMQPIAPLPAQNQKGLQPIAPRATGEVNPSAAAESTTTTVTNTDGSTTTTITTNGYSTTTTTTTATEVVPIDDPPSIAVMRVASREEAKAGNCPAEARVLDQGMDLNRDGILNPGEITNKSVSCQD